MSVLEAARAAGLRLPLLCKPLLACGPVSAQPLAYNCPTLCKPLLLVYSRYY